ncbi:MAG: aminopeptidase [Desulfobacterales bacterium]|nr:aminopeptidase [Desulfobacterales bacterium]
MLTAKQLDRYAQVMLWALQTARKHKFRPNDIVLLRYDLPGRPLAERLFAGLMEMGIHPVLRAMPTPAIEKTFYQVARPRQLVFTPPGEAELMEALNGSIFIYAPESITHLGGIDPARIGKTLVARKPLKDILDARDEKGAFGWTLCLMPTEELARQAGLPLAAYSNQVARACFLNRSQPLDHWQSVFRQATAIKKRLNRLPIDRLRVESRRTDLEITLGENRRWIGLSGHNIPSFELFTSPDWRGTRGVYFADQPSFRSGNRVAGVRLEFKQGKVVAVQADQGEAFVRQQLAMDRGACRLGEFSLTDKRFSKINAFMANTLYDENYGGRHGNCHVALGSSYADTFSGRPRELTPAQKKRLGFNASALHWDLVNTEPKRVTARLKQGGELTLYANGRFRI